mgnify:FL=1
MNNIKMIWNLQNITLDMCGLDPEMNLLQAPECPCGCGDTTTLFVEDMNDLYNLVYTLTDECSEYYCGIFAITEDNHLIMAMTTSDGISMYSVPESIDYKIIGSLVDNLGLDGYVLLVHTKNGYKIVEE